MLAPRQSADSLDPRADLGPSWLGQPIDPLDDPWYRFVRLLRAIKGSVTIPAGARWLDLGCHQGQFVTLVAARYGVDATGADNWQANLKGDGTWRYVQANLDAEFDLGRDFAFVSALEVLEHMIDTDAFLDRCGRHLGPGGHLVLTTPNINSLRNRVMVPLGAYPTGLEYRNEIHHVRLYNAPTLRKHVSEHGFEVTWVKGVSALPKRAFGGGLSGSFDRALADRFPQLCGNIMLLARKR